MAVYEAVPGQHVSQAADEMIRMAEESGEAVTCSFNDIPMTASPGMTAEVVAEAYQAESERRSREWRASPEYAKQQAEMKTRWEGRKAELAAALKYAPAQPNFISQKKWDDWRDIQKDGYSQAVFRYAENWARLIESQMTGPNPRTLEECAEEASSLADDEGVSGFMVSLAVGVLAQTWIHGKALRQWYRRSWRIWEREGTGDDT